MIISYEDMGLLGESAEFQEDDSSNDNTPPGHLHALSRQEVEQLLSETKDLSGKDMRKANLAKLDFSDCDLRKANFSYAILKECNFQNADLREASLWNANLENANLTSANLECSDLDYAKLRGAILYKANVRRAHLPVDLIPREDIMKSVEKGGEVSKS